MRALMFRQGSLITLKDIIEACQSEYPSIVDTPKQTVDSIESILNQLEVGEGDFWSQVHKPFKKNIITKGTVKDLIQTARNRYQANLPGLAVKLGACTRHYQSNSEELKKFTSFKNFLYKTVKISESN